MPAYISNINSLVFQGSPGEYLVIKWKDIKKRYQKEHWLREKCPYSEFFWSIFSRIRAEYAVWILENTDQKNFEYRHFSRRGYQLKMMKNLLVALNSSPWKYLLIFWWDVETKHWYDMGWFCRSSQPEVFLRTGTLKIYS